MHVYADIARQHGVDPTNETAIDEFFTTTVPGMSEHDQQAIFTQLLQREHEILPPILMEAVQKLVDIIMREEISTIRQIRHACTVSQSISDLREQILNITKSLEEKRTRQIQQLSQS